MSFKGVFFGTPEYVLPILTKFEKNLRGGFERNLMGVVTQAPKPAGREKRVSYSAVDKWAYKKKVPIYYEAENAPEADIGVCVAYGEIIPEGVINRFKYGILNVHPSLLPKWRGASPVQASILAGEAETGVSIIKMDKELDHGPIVSSFRDRIMESDTTESLTLRLFERAGEFLEGLLPSYLAGKINPKEQEHEKASFTRTIKKADGFIEPSVLEPALNGLKLKAEGFKIRWADLKLEATPVALERFIRAMSPWPGTWTFVRTKDVERRVKILYAHVEDEKLVIDKVQLEGKGEVSWKQFKEGYPEARFGELGRRGSS